MTWFMDPMPDGNQVRLMGSTLRTAHGDYSPFVTNTQTELDTTGMVWQSPTSTQHTAIATQTQTAAQAHQQWLIAAADVLDTASTLLQIIGLLQMAWLAIQAGSFIFGLLTGGVGFIEGEATDAAVGASIQATRFSLETILKTVFKALLDHLVQVAGTLVGAGFGAYQGIQTIEQKHLSGGDAALTLLGDITSGAFAGLTITTSPGAALAGAGLGTAQIGVHDALGQNVSQQDAFSIITTDIVGAGGLDGVGVDDGINGPESVPAGGKLGKGDYSGPWVYDAVPGTVEKGGTIQQSLPGSCVSAAGSGLTNGAVSEADLLAKLGQNSDVGPLLKELNANPNTGTYTGRYFLDPSGQEAVDVAKLGPMAAKLQAPGGIGHMVLIEPADNGTFLVHDPLPQGVGSTYKVTADWIKKYVSAGVWPKPSTP